MVTAAQEVLDIKTDLPVFKHANFVENHAYDDQQKKRDNVLNAIMPIGNKNNQNEFERSSIKKRDLLHVHL